MKISRHTRVTYNLTGEAKLWQIHAKWTFIMTAERSSCVHIQGGPKKVSHYQVSSLNRIKHRH